MYPKLCIPQTQAGFNSEINPLIIELMAALLKYAGAYDIFPLFYMKKLQFLSGRMAKSQNSYFPTPANPKQTIYSEEISAYLVSIDNSRLRGNAY